MRYDCGDGQLNSSVNITGHVTKYYGWKKNLFDVRDVKPTSKWYIYINWCYGMGWPVTCVMPALMYAA